MLRVRVAPSQERVKGSDKEGQSVNSGDGRELNQRDVRRRRIAEQVPRKTDFGQPGSRHFEHDPEKWRANASQRDAAQRKSMDGPGDGAVEGGPHRGDQEQYTPSACAGKAAMHGEDFGDPWDRR